VVRLRERSMFRVRLKNMSSLRFVRLMIRFSLRHIMRGVKTKMWKRLRLRMVIPLIT